MQLKTKIIKGHFGSKGRNNLIVDVIKELGRNCNQRMKIKAQQKIHKIGILCQKVY